MTYQVTARKWRPMIFEDVIGQSHVTDTLRNAITSGRVAHAFLFSGSRGCGKTTTARILAKAINCLSPVKSNPDNTCEICKEITAGTSLDVIEIDGASNRGIEEIRNLREAARYTPTRAKYKVYVIDEVHMLTKEAFNALLKTLEEPPPHVIFVFATTEIHRVPATILSRCQRFDFRRISVDEIQKHLQRIAEGEGVSIEENAALVLARKGDGSMRDAQSFFDQVRAFCGDTIALKDVLTTLNVLDQEVYFRVTDFIQSRNEKSGIELVDSLFQSGFDLREFVSGLAEHLRHLLVTRTTGSTALVETSDVYRQKYDQEAKKFTEADLLRLIKVVHDLEATIKWSPQPRFKLEVALLQMITMERSVTIQKLLDEINQLKKKHPDGQPRSQRDIHSTTPEPPVMSTPRQEWAGNKENIRVVGTVSAGPLRAAASSGRSAMPERAFQRSISASMPAVTRSQGAAMSQIESATTTSTIKPISPSEAYARWQEWIQEVRKAKISVGSVLTETRLIDAARGALRIECPDDYHISSLKRNREFLVETFRRLTGYDVRIELVMPEAQARPSIPSVQPAVKEPDVLTPEATGLQHPVVLALQRELGAEPVE